MRISFTMGDKSLMKKNVIITIHWKITDMQWVKNVMSKVNSVYFSNLLQISSVQSIELFVNGLTQFLQITCHEQQFDQPILKLVNSCIQILADPSLGGKVGYILYMM